MTTQDVARPTRLEIQPTHGTRKDSRTGENEELLVLHGTVSEQGASQQPVADARLEACVIRGQGLEPLWLGETRSLEDGSYRLEIQKRIDVPSLIRSQCKLWLQTEAAEFQPSSTGRDLDEVMDGSTLIDVQLKRGPALHGRVFEPSGKPAAGALILLQVLTGENSSTTRSETTNARGEFRIGLAPGQPLYLVASKQGFVPSDLDLSGWDTEAEQDLGDLFLGVGAQIGGRLTCADGTPLPGLHLSASAEDQVPRGQGVFINAHTSTDANGDFVFSGLRGNRFEIDLGPKTSGPFEAGRMDIELVYPNRLLRVRVEDEEGRALPGTYVDALVGKEISGRFTIQQWLGATANGERGIALFDLLEETRGVLQTELWDGHTVQHSFAFPENRCAWEEVFVLPEEIPTGFLVIDVDNPTGRAFESFELALESPLVSAPLYSLDGAGPHELATGIYRGRMEVGNVWDSDFVPLEYEHLEIKDGQTTHLAAHLELGGRIFLTVIPSAFVEESPGDAAVWILENGGRQYATFMGSEHAFALALPPNRPYLIDRVFPPGTVRLEVHLAGHRTIIENVKVTPGEVTEHVVYPFPEVDGGSGR